MTFGIVTVIGEDPACTTLPVDHQSVLRIGTTSNADISLRGLAADLEKSGIAPSLVARDLLILATTIFAADTRIQRENGDDGWTREITLSVPVSDPARWNGAKAAIKRALRFLTGDIWELDFRSSATAISLSTNRDPAKTPGGAAVSLFSGGLDSFIGALDFVKAGGPLVLVGHYTDGSTSKPQDTAFKHVYSLIQAAQHVSLLRAWIVAPSDVFGSGNDDRQRSRSFLFFAIGVLVAEAIESQELIVPENGLISLNVPLTDLRIGSYSTRTTHPHYMSLVQVALDELGIAVRLRNPYQFKTKGEMLSECAAPEGLLKAAATTMSCAHPTASRWLRKGAPPLQHCGRCTACLIRRAALLRGFGDDLTSYTEVDLHAAPLPSNTARGKDVRAVRLAARRVVDNPGIAELLILKPGPLPGYYAEYADLYRRGMSELWTLLERVETRGAY